MLKENPIIAYAADCRGNAENCLYPNRTEIRDNESAIAALSRDCVFAEYRDNRRSKANFIQSNVIPLDCDNDHSDNPSEWITAEMLSGNFPDVPHIIQFSRHHMKQKEDKTPRPRFHVLFLIDPVSDESEYAELKERVCRYFPYFDINAIDSGRFFFGTEKPEVVVRDGGTVLNRFLDENDAAECFLLESQTPIAEGSRNNTLSKIGASIVKRYGMTEDAYRIFLEAATRCDPPLDDDEVERIWNGKKKFYEEIKKQPGYVSPEVYNGSVPPVWDTPIPFDDYNLPTFPVDALPDVIATYATAVSVSTQTSPDMAAVAALGVLALCVQGKFIIAGSDSWIEPLNEYFVIILPPAERKSAVMARMVSPVERYESEVNAGLAEKLIESRMMQDALEKEKRTLIEKVSKKKATQEDVAAKAAEIAAFHAIKPLRLFVDDVTSEKLTSVLADNDGRGAIVSAEGGIFDILSGMYSKSVNIDVFLKGHSGDTIRVDRIGRESESIFHPALTILLAVQPDVLNGLMSNNTFRGRGLTARFLYAMPKSSVGNRTFRTPSIPEKASEDYEKIIRELLSLQKRGEALMLSDEAKEILEAFFNEIEARLRDDLSDIADWAGKCVGAVLRLSGILHLVKYHVATEFSPVGAETMTNAVAIGRYFIEHAKAAYALMGADQVNKSAEYLITAVKRSGLAEFSRRDAMRLCRRFKTAESLQPVLNRLCDYGYIAPKPSDAPLSFGRKPSEVYLTNPLILINEKE